MTNEMTQEEFQQHIMEVLRGCPDGRGLDEESLYAAVKLLAEVKGLLATIHLLQRGEVLGFVDADGEVALRYPEGATKALIKFILC